MFLAEIIVRLWPQELALRIRSQIMQLFEQDTGSILPTQIMAASMTLRCGLLVTATSDRSRQQILESHQH
jgi:hypothetical protein